MTELKRSPDWKLGAKAGITLISADANARAVADQNMFAYVFDGQGLHAGVSLDAFEVWKTGQRRP
ncbi:MAG: hypothetical protein HY053_08005 [Proteobacteria bacterium]|nr:hypothetical protein [Pseudomonadota bacterium]